MVFCVVVVEAVETIEAVEAVEVVEEEGGQKKKDEDIVYPI